jgi:5'(3')-deoxyribonucleotidase
MSEKEIVYVDMDDVLCDYTVAHRRVREEHPGIRFPQSLSGFFEQLPPIEGAIDAINRLQREFHVFVLSAPSTRNPLSYAEKRIWIERHFDYAFTKKLILSPDKGLLKGRYLIDDHDSGKGQERFEGELILFRSERFPDWSAVLTYLGCRVPIDQPESRCPPS